MLNLTLGSHKSPKLLYLSQHHLPFIWQSALHLPPAKMKIQLAVECLLLLVLFIVPSQEAEQYQTLLSMRKARGSNQGNNTEWLSEYTSIALRRKSDYRRVMSSQDGSQEADRITALPGQPSGAKFSQYGGYVTVDSSKGKALYYYLTEATDDPASKPLVLWLNGGPGCSSVGYGAFNELGPFRVNEDGKTLSSNPYAWNKVANILFLESPVGVGFSYSNTSAGYDQIGDKRTAEDAFTFLINWLERFPQYKNRDFYMTGESYAGNYVPELAHVILTHTQDFPQKPPISLKGIMMGNAVINVPTDNLGYYTYMWSHALIPDEIFDGIISNCNLSSNFITTTCADFENQATKLIGNIDPYSIYAPVCSAYKDQGPGVSSAYYDPCSLQYTKMYLNRPDVQKALHANIIGLPFAWDACSNFLFNNWNDTPSTMFPIYRELFNAAIPFMLYSGDVDSIVPVTSTRLSINELKLPIKTPWYPWEDGDEVGGYSVVYEGLTFATIRGAGHQVPSYEPARVLTAFTRFLAGKPL